MVVLCNQSVVDGGTPIDAAINDVSRAVMEGHWQPNPASEERRLALLPNSPALAWDTLMVSERYMHALTLIP
jgi:beta-N-acetylhexosaminidase